MKTFSLWKVIPAALAIVLAANEASLAQAKLIQINSKLPSDPLVLSGKSGGTVKSNCGNLTATPNHVIEFTQSLLYLRVSVAGEGQPTLLIDGPGGRFCVLPDTYSGGKPEMSGYWPSGKYSLSVGNLSPGEHNYNLSISQQK